jgi:hypothetical protein
MIRTGVVALAGACALTAGTLLAAPAEQAAVMRVTKDAQGYWFTDGNVLTEDFPKDHIHHRGIFWAWHQVRINGKTVLDQWVNRDSFWMVRDAQPASDGDSASLALRVDWESPLFTDAHGQRRPFVEERSVTRVHRAAGAIRKIDFHQRLTALVDGVEIGGSDDAKGYGGFRSAS